MISNTLPLFTSLGLSSGVHIGSFQRYEINKGAFKYIYRETQTHLLTSHLGALIPD